jgi:hypothetical protein
MIVSYGTKGKVIGGPQKQGMACSSCGNTTQSTFGVIRYFHIFWIPVLPYKKEVGTECQQCKQTLMGKEVPDNVRQDIKENVFTKGRLLPMFAGLILIALFAGSLAYINVERSKKEAAYLANPAANDYYIVKLTEMFEGQDASYPYGVMKVQSIEEGELALQVGTYGYSEFGGARQAIKKGETAKEGYFSEEMLSVEAGSLQQLKSDGAIRSVKRFYRPAARISSPTIRLNRRISMTPERHEEESRELWTGRHMRIQRKSMKPRVFALLATSFLFAVALSLPSAFAESPNSPAGEKLSYEVIDGRLSVFGHVLTPRFPVKASDPEEEDDTLVGLIHSPSGRWVIIRTGRRLELEMWLYDARTQEAPRKILTGGGSHVSSYWHGDDAFEIRHAGMGYWKSDFFLSRDFGKTFQVNFLLLFDPGRDIYVSFYIDGVEVGRGFDRAGSHPERFDMDLEYTYASDAAFTIEKVELRDRHLVVSHRKADGTIVQETFTPRHLERVKE